MAQLGQQYASRGLSIPLTLEVRPGYRFVVMVTKDMVFPSPWRGEASPLSSRQEGPSRWTPMLAQVESMGILLAYLNPDGSGYKITVRCHHEHGRHG